MEHNKFDGLAVSSKLFICGLPIRLDSYKTCSFGCKYCFANCRKVMEFKKELQVCDTARVERVIVQSQMGEGGTLLHQLIREGITWHCGGMSDPFQPIEKELGITRDLVDISNRYGIEILFSTKSDTTYGANLDPELHSFQLSVTNVHNDDIEPNVPNIKSRYRFYRQLKDNGFRVGIRIQPFLPNISTEEIVDIFSDADNFTIEGIKLVPQNEEMKTDILQRLGLTPQMFTQMGLLNLKPQYRLQLYEPIIERLKQYGIPYSISDNDLRKYGTNLCCCGDGLVGKFSTMNPTYLLKSNGVITQQGLLRESELLGISELPCYHLFSSNRTQGCKTVKDCILKRYADSACTFSNNYQYGQDNQLTLF